MTREKFFVLASLCIITVSCSSCDRKPSSSGSSYTKSIGNKQVTQGNCPDTQGLSELRLPNNSIADVRIFLVDGHKLFVPREWLVRNQPDSEWTFGENAITPLVSSTECPGVVHVFTGKNVPFDLGFRFVDRVRSTSVKNISLNTKIDMVSVVKPVGHDFTDKIIEWPTREAPSAWIGIVPGTFAARYAWPRSKTINDPDWATYREAVKELVKWIMTPPRDRDNDHVFKLGVE